MSRELSKHGIPKDRIVVDVGAESDFPPHASERSLVVLSVLPAHPVREDFEPSSNEYRSFCGAQAR